ncbi:rab4 protein [Anaeramoeba ignava]|uniref:Rab4 protein n=1 Tax=Anaeramoeba ignava TaxID=1746090 RepID=A0A9Q0RD23_ANAIG|nr:rab4 protein [Anaeramoeba ignava]
MKRLVSDTFDEFEDRTKPTNLCFNTKQYESKDGKKYSFGIWDTAGEEEFDSISTFYYRGAGCALLVYDITNRKSYDGLSRFLSKLTVTNPEAILVIIGSKLDLVESDPNLRKVTTEEANQKAKTLKSMFFEVSSKTGENVQELWKKIGISYESTLQTQNPTPIQNKKPSSRIDLKKGKKKKKRC